MPNALIDKEGGNVAKLHQLWFDDKSSAYRGNIEFVDAPVGLKELLDHLEELVEDQTFALVDGVQGQIDAFNFYVLLDDGTKHLICDLYVAKDGACSFRKSDG